MTPQPVLFTWDGEAMLPINASMQKLCDELYVIGERYRLIELQERSRNSHNHYFAALAQAWQNLPEDLAERFPSPEHLRKYALIKCGFYNSRSIVASSAKQARDLASFMKGLDEFSIVVAREATVTLYSAQSQSLKAMGKASFGTSKTQVLDFVASLIGTTQAQITQNMETAA